MQMAADRRRSCVLSVVERGWHGARDCSLALNGRAIPVRHLIKGRLPRALRAIITPYPHIRITSAPRPLFPLALWWAIATQTAAGRLRWLLVDHERTWSRVQWWCRAFGLTPLLIREFDDHFELSAGRRIVSMAEAFGS